jgi:hypothetical protein
MIVLSLIAYCCIRLRDSWKERSEHGPIIHHIEVAQQQHDETTNRSSFTITPPATPPSPLHHSSMTPSTLTPAVELSSIPVGMEDSPAVVSEKKKSLPSSGGGDTGTSGTSAPPTPTLSPSMHHSSNSMTNVMI